MKREAAPRKKTRRSAGRQPPLLVTDSVFFDSGLFPKGAWASHAASRAGHDLEEVRRELSGRVELQHCEGLLVDAVDGLGIELEVLLEATCLLDDGLGDAAAPREVPCGGDGRPRNLPGLAGDYVNVVACKHSAKFLEAEDVVDALPDRLHSLRNAGADEDYLASRMLRTGNLGGEDHGAGGRGDVFHEVGKKLADELHVCGAAGCGHELFAGVHPLLELAGLVFGGHFGAEGDLHYIVEPEPADGGEELLDCSCELGGRGRRDHCDHLLATLKRKEDVQELGLLHDCAERALGEAVSAGDALLGVDGGMPLLVLVDGAGGACVLAGDSRLDNCMERADGDALSALDALAVVDSRGLVYDVDGILRAVVHARAREAPPAVARHNHPGAWAFRASRLADGEGYLLGVGVCDRGGSFACLAVVRGQRPRLVSLLLAGKSQQAHYAVFDDGAVVVDAASAGAALPGPQRDGQPVEFRLERAVVEGTDEADHEFSP